MLTALALLTRECQQTIITGRHLTYGDRSYPSTFVIVYIPLQGSNKEGTSRHAIRHGLFETLNDAVS
jgi:hypothetical protein